MSIIFRTSPRVDPRGRNSGINKLVVEVSPGAKGRYFVGICASGLDDAGIRIFSPWKVYTDNATGLPLQISTAPESSIETFYCRAIAISDSEAVFMLQCGLDNPSTCTLTVNCGTTVRRISMENFSGILQVTDMADAISKSRSPSGYKDLVIVNNSAKPNKFTLFMIFNKGTATEIIYSCKRNTGTSFKVLADNSKANIVTDYGFKDMVKTILALERMPDTVKNPVTYTGSLPAIDDKQEKLMASAILFHSLVHNSPIENRNEVEQGVFSNYIQFADSVVRSWGTIGTTASGFERLEEMYELVLAQNKGDLIDPIYVRNNGTLSDYGKPVKERKNFAFYEGYTRLDVDLDYSLGGAPALTGAGIVFRVSDNIEVYEANLADTFNMFGDPLIPCTTGSRRIIIAANDILLGKLATDGIWVKGKDESKGEQQYYIGVSKMRVPLQAVAGAKPVEVAFTLSNESPEAGDPIGTITGGAESNFFRMYALSVNPDGTEDTIYNNSNPEILLHHQRRMIEIDSNYIGKDVSFKFDVIGTDSSHKKLFVESNNGYRAVIKDTSQEEGKTIVRLSFNDALTYVGERWMLVSKLFSEEAKNGNLRKNGLIRHPYEIKTPLFYKFNMIPELNNNGMVVITMSDRIKVCTDEFMTNPWGDFTVQKNKMKIMQKSWGEYQKLLSPGQSLYFESNGVGKETVTIALFWPSSIMRGKSGNVSIQPTNCSVSEKITFVTKNDGQIVLEPINNEVVTGTLSEVYNPVCVAVGDNASFKIEISRPGFTPDMVTWTSKNKRVKFVDGSGVLSDQGTGLVAKVRGTTVGEDQLIIDIAGYDGIMPRIDFSLVTPKTVNVFTYMVKSDIGASEWTDTEIENKIDTANSILKQIGVTLNRINGAEIWKNIYYEIKDETSSLSLVNENSGTGGLEIYFNKVIHDKSLGAAHNKINYGIIFPKFDNDELTQLSARDLTHEIMHSARQTTSDPINCHFLDIYDHHKNVYDPKEINRNKIIAYVPASLKIAKHYLPNDYVIDYKTSETHVNLIKKLLEYGYCQKDALDIPRGDIYGLPAYYKGTGPIPPIPRPPGKKMVECGYLKIQDRVFVHQN